MRVRRHALLALLLFATVAGQSPDDLDEFITTQMGRRHVPGLSIAIIQDGRIVVARGYGVTEAGGNTPVTTSTLFQAGSVSKSVAAVGALHLVEAGVLSLDGNVNDKLTTWKVPDNAFTRQRPVTLRGILSHTAGLTVHGFPGYATTDAMPTLVQVLDGAAPANTEAIRVDTAPGSLWRYSGGGYTVMQQMVVDATHTDFPEFMRTTVLEPFGMRSSSYQQPLPASMQGATATGHYDNRRTVAGRWHIYPEMAAAGLWTTPSDLARFVIGVQQMLAGNPPAVLSQAMARQMVTVERDGDGLGVFIGGTGPAQTFSHNGRDEGFDALMVGSLQNGFGLVIMINTNDDSRMVGAISAFVARRYGFPGAPALVAARTRVAVPASALRSLAGRYELQNNRMIELATNDTAIQVLIGGFPDEEFVPQDSGRFLSGVRQVEFTPVRDGSGAVTGLAWRVGSGAPRMVPRIGPFVALLPRSADPAPALTARARSAIAALAAGGAASAQSPDLTEGAKRDFGRAPQPSLANLRLAFVGSENVAGRGIERHGGAVARILYFEFSDVTGRHYLMAHLTQDGVVTDTDVIER